MTAEGFIFDEGLLADGMTEKGVTVLRELVGGGYVQVEIRDDQLVLYAYLDTPEGNSDCIELGRINLYHVVGYAAQNMDHEQLDAFATLFRNIATLIESDAIYSRHQNATGFNHTTFLPLVRRVK